MEFDDKCESFDFEKSTVWDFPIRGDWATHKGDYRGNFAPQIPRNIINNYSNEGDLVLDPMVGSGTTLIEAKIMGRSAIGIDINQNAINITNERLNFSTKINSIQTVYRGDVRKMGFLSSCSVDLIITHPPYFNLVKYSDGVNPDDLSSCKSIPSFLDSFEDAAKELFRVLKPNHYCAILIGDTRKGQHYIPLSLFVLQRCLRSGFVLKEEIIKTQHNTTHGPRWVSNANRYKFYLIMHEHLYVFRKPLPDENLSKIRFSTWKGVQKAQDEEIEEEWKGLVDFK